MSGLVVSGTDGADALIADAAGNTLLGLAGNDTLRGADGGDSLDGGAGNDAIYADGGNDTLRGSVGNDHLSGGAGEDLYVFDLGWGQDRISNFDTVSFDTIEFGVGILPQDIQVGKDFRHMILTTINGDSIIVTDHFRYTSYQIEMVRFADGTIWNLDDLETLANTATEQDNYLIGTDSNDTILGLGGVDRIEGEGGDDSLDGGADTDFLTGGDGNDTLRGGAGNDILSGDDLGGESGDDVYVFALGWGHDNILNYTGGLKVIEFEAGILKSDISGQWLDSDLVLTHTNGDKITVDGHFHFTNYRIDEVRFADGTVWDFDDLWVLTNVATGLGDTLRGLDANDTLSGLQGNDSILGNDGNDLLIGGSGNDTIAGSSGNDTLRGGTGNDDLSGGSGNDLFIFELGWGQDSVSDSRSSSSVIVNRIEFGTGVFSVDVSGRWVGNDLVLTHVNGDSVEINNQFLASGSRIQEVRFADGTVWDLDDLTTLTNVSTELADTLTGGSKSDTLAGLQGDDRLLGNEGDDFLFGGAGNDVISGHNGSDYLRGGSGDDALYGAAGNDTLVGGAGNDVLDGGSGDNLYSFDFGWGHDTILIFEHDSEAIEFGNGVLPSDVHFQRVDGKFVLIHVNGDTIKFDQYIDQVSFFDGTVWDRGNLINIIEYGRPDGANVEQFAKQLTDGYWESIGEARRIFDIDASRQITYSVKDLDAQGAYFARAALDAWSESSGLVFVETTTNAQIIFDNEERGAHAYYDLAGPYIDTAYINVHPSISAGDPLQPWGFAFEVYLHEIGHALGLGHPGNYNFTATYGEDNLFPNDSTQYTIMSYFFPGDHEYAPGTNAYIFSPQVADVEAINALYGLNPTRNPGDTDYVFWWQSGDVKVTHEDVPRFFTVQDSGGIDWFSFYDTNADQVIDLREGEFSSIAGLSLNLAIAPGSVIENADSGVGDDLLIGNSHDNELYGGDGNDTLRGGLGNDTIVGGSGNDYLEPGDNSNVDAIRPGTGHDTIVFSDMITGQASVQLWDLDAGVRVWINGTANTGYINKGANGSAELVDVSVPLPTEIGGLVIDGTVHDDTYTATAGAGGFLVIRTYAGNDTFNLKASNGHIRLAFDDWQITNGVTIDLTTGIVSDDGHGMTDKINGVANLSSVHMTMLADSVLGNNQDNQFILKAGNDTVNGAGGFDLLRYDRTGVEAVTLDLNTGTATGTWRGEAFTHTISNIEHVRGSRDGHDDLTGRNGQNNRIEGRGGRDTIDGGANGNDTLEGGDGNDDIAGLSGNDLIDGGNGHDLLQGEGGRDTLQGGAGADTLQGGAGDDTLYGGNQDDKLDGGDGDDRIWGGLGRDKAYLGDGNDVFNDDAQNDQFGGDKVYGGSGNDTINGGGGHDEFRGNDGADQVSGGVGNDTLYGGNQNDTIHGGNGHDRIWGGLGRDDIFMGNGNDVFNDEAQNDQFGRDTVYAGSGNDTINGGGGNDEFRGDGGADKVNGGLGNDTLHGGNQNDTIYGDDGDDRIWGGLGRDNIFMGDGNDVFNDEAQNDQFGRDKVFGGIGNDTINGGGGHDEFRGNDGADLVSGGTGNDTLYGGNQDDTIKGGDGDDHIWGGLGRDTIFMGNGNDVFNDEAQNDQFGRDIVYGGNGNDTINGGGGHDTIYGGNGADLLNGGAGNDTLRGGADADVLVFSSGEDQVIGFGPGDRIDLSGVSEITDFADLQANHLSGGADAVIGDGVGNTMTLVGVAEGVLDAGDFIF
ncbi:calcium-binding protein [Ruegeria sp. 2205SS24-7]|uniref:calcium-binding protein n=1 Tax=Ruegeria discodermiae TaxID=3064389 RepID=UPI002742810C|nr:calcium-binding protein [Ruegeria sp. 2205SS24-7]MDP5220713.1 calcium-binding protein [Ruegeria sp. 2205SS24-7]